MGIRIYSNSFSNPEYYSYSYSLKVDSTNNIRIRIRVKIIIRDNTAVYTVYVCTLCTILTNQFKMNEIIVSHYHIELLTLSSSWP